MYLTLAEKHELYYESYNMVAVMFATLKNFQMDMSQLRVLNEIISEFDTVVRSIVDSQLPISHELSFP